MSSTETSGDVAVTASRPSLLPTAVIGLAVLVVAIVFASTATWYQVFLAVHVVFVVIWIGGGALLTILGVVAERRTDPTELLSIARMAAFAGERIFSPAAIVVLAMGVAMMMNGDIPADQFWIIFALLGFATTFLIGVAVLSPMSKRVAKVLETHGPASPEARAAVSKILLIARVDVGVLLLVVVDMTVKPFL